MIAFEIAIQLQSEVKKVEKLIMLDGSPLYIQAQISQAIKGLPTNSSQEQVWKHCSFSTEVAFTVNGRKIQTK